LIVKSLGNNLAMKNSLIDQRGVFWKSDETRQELLKKLFKVWILLTGYWGRSLKCRNLSQVRKLQRFFVYCAWLYWKDDSKWYRNAL